MKRILFLVVVLSLAVAAMGSGAVNNECVKKFPLYVDGSFVCVCNSTYCDTIEPLGADRIDKTTDYVEYVTSKREYRLNRFTGKLASQGSASASLNITINPDKKYQRIFGFGGAMTDSTGLMVFDLPSDAMLNFLKSYFDPSGLEYNIIRVPVAGADFSTRCYTYDETPGDFNMTNFQLSEEDTGVKIPLIQAAKRLSETPIKLFASAWSAPPWMKTNNRYDGNGTLKGQPGGEYYQAWALYYVKFFQEYQKHNLSFWAMTAQNEPTDGYIAKFPFNGMGFTPETQAEFIVTNLGPTLEANGLGDIKIMILDDQRLFLPSWAERVFAYSPDKAKKYVSGVAVHWYMDSFIPANVLDKTHDKFPDKWIFATEACTGTIPLLPHVFLGEFSRAESYARDIIEDLNHWTTGWTDWNMALGMDGGPNWANNFVDSPIIVNTEGEEFYKQPMYYALGHFSKFIRENSIRVDTNGVSKVKHVSYVAFDNEDLKQMTLVILNQSDHDYDYSIYEPRTDKYINSQVQAHSIKSIIWYY